MEKQMIIEQPKVTSKQQTGNAALKEPWIIRFLLTTISLLFLLIFLVLPLVTIFITAFKKGIDVYIASITEPDALSAIKLTLLVALVVVPINTIFGIACAWVITKFDFRGKNLLTTLIDLPFAVSPVIAGLVFILLFGAEGLFGEWLLNHNIQIIFALPGIILASLFITVPFVARELIPLMQTQGKQEEEASISLGAGAFTTFIKVTLPNIKWGLLYGVILCNARVMGEFGAVSVVSGHVRGLTNTMPLHIEVLYNEYQFSSAFAVASLMSILALITIVIKNIIEWKTKH